MTMLEIHATALASVNTSYHEFLLKYKTNSKVVYGLVEGKEDPSFYKGLIEHNLPAGWEIELIKSGCKDKVLKAFGVFDWTRFSPKRICFFVDRDLSAFMPEPAFAAENIYVTDNYSIENDAINVGTLKRILEEILNINKLSVDDNEQIKNRFFAGLQVFREAMTPVMAQIIIWRRNGNRALLSEIKPKNFFLFSNGIISLKPEFEIAESRVQEASSCVGVNASPMDEIAKTEQEFRQNQGIEKFIRGKYLIWFLVEFSLEIHRSIATICNKYTKPPKLKISMGSSNAMLFIAPRVRCPVSLQNFLVRNYCEYIGEIEPRN